MSPQDEPTVSQDASILAYLDGELDEAAAAVFEQRMLDDPELKRRVAQHAGTWELLGVIQQGGASEDFTERTLAQATLNQTTRPTKTPSVLERPGRRVTWIAAAVCLAAGLGGAIAGVGRPRQIPQLTDSEWRAARELQRFENVPGVRFLQQAAEKGLVDAD